MKTVCIILGNKVCIVFCRRQLQSESVIFSNFTLRFTHNLLILVLDIQWPKSQVRVVQEFIRQSKSVVLYLTL